jgi:hypothetical protein
MHASRDAIAHVLPPRKIGTQLDDFTREVAPAAAARRGDGVDVLDVGGVEGYGVDFDEEIVGGEGGERDGLS